MSRKRKLTPDQHRVLAERHMLWMRLRLEAAKHSPYTLARELGVSPSTLRAYLNRKAAGKDECPYPRCKHERGHIGAHVI